MPENSTNRGYPLPVAGDAFTPQGSVNALGVAVDADVQALADDVADASGIDDGAIGPAKLDRAYVVDGKTYVRAGVGAGTQFPDASQSVAIGFQAMRDVAGISSVAIGYQSQLEASGSHSTAVGHQTQRTASGDYSVAVGYSAQELSSGDRAIAIGYQAQLQSSAPDSVAIGSLAQRDSAATESVAVGAYAQNRTWLAQNASVFAGPLRVGVRYRIGGTNKAVDGVPLPDGVIPPYTLYTGTGSEVEITADGDLSVQEFSLQSIVDYHTAVGARSVADHPGGIALGYNAYADTDRQVQVGTAIEVNGVEPPNALRVGVHDAILTTDTPTTDQVLQFDGTDWKTVTLDYNDLTNKPTLGTAAATDATDYATAAQGALADSAVQPGDLQSLADAVDADVEALESRTITAGTGLTGGGDLSANRTLSVDTGGIDTAQLADGAVTPAKSSLGLGFGLGARPTVSRYLTLPGASVASFTAAWERIYMMPLHLWAGTLTRIGIEVVTGQPSAQVRLGIYAARDTDGRPIPAVDPLLDAGAVDASTSGIKEITISHTVTTPGWVYLAAFVYGGSGTGIDLYGLSGAPITPITTVQSLVYGTGTTSALIAFNRPGETSLVQLNEFPSFGHLIPRIVVRY